MLHPKVQVFSSLGLGDSLHFDKNHNKFPTETSLGKISLVQDALFLYTNLNGLNTWYPITRRKATFVHTQAVSSLKWTVVHNLNSKDVLVITYNSNDEIIYPTISYINENSIELNFSNVIVGKAIVFADLDSTKIDTGVMDIGVTLPLVKSGSASAPVLSINLATTSNNGLMSNTDKTKLDGIAAGAQVNVPTNLSVGTRTGTVLPLLSSTGTSVNLPVVTTSLAGLMSNTDKTKLDGIAAGAQVNVPTNITVSGSGNTRTISSSTGTSGNISFSAADVGAPSLTGVGASGSWGINVTGSANNLGVILNTTHTSSTFQNQWTKVATITLNTRYHDSAITLYVKSRGSGSTTDHYDKLIFRVKQQNDFGSNPFVDLLPFVFGAEAARYGYVIVQNTPSTIVDLYIQNLWSWNVIQAVELSRALGGGTITYHSNQVYATSIPNIIQSNNRIIITSQSLINSTGDFTWTFNASNQANGILKNSGVTAGTFTKFTTNAKGIITAATNLVESDIPNLNASKITAGTISVDRLPPQALIGDTTYTAGVGLTLVGTEFRNSAPHIATNLSYVSSSRTLSSSTGTAVILPLATTTDAGLMSNTDKTKLDGIAAGATANSGTVTSIAISVPTGLSVSGSPITTSGTIALSLQSGYSIPTTAKQTNWDTAHGWGNHASAGYLTSLNHTHGIANSAGTQQFSFGVNENIRISGSGATTVTFDSATKNITISSVNTTYSAGTGLSLVGSTFSLSGVSFSSSDKTKLDSIVIATLAESIQGTSNTVYATPKSIKDFIENKNFLIDYGEY